MARRPPASRPLYWGINGQAKQGKQGLCHGCAIIAASMAQSGVGSDPSFPIQA